MPATGRIPLTWPAEIYRVLKEANVTQACYVPDAGHSRLIQLLHADPEIATTVLTTEEEGIALAAGAWLGGQRSVLLLQSSGVGNCINMLSLMATCRFPLLALVTMRGEWAEFNPWQMPMGQATPGALELMGVKTMRVERGGRGGRDGGRRGRARLRWRSADRRAALPAHAGPQEMGGEMTPAANSALSIAARRSRELLKDRGKLLLVTGLGSSSYDAFAAGDHEANFYLWGAMGGAAMMGLGLALAQPGRPVCVLTGDGEQLMGLGALATIAVKKPANLTIVVLDNGHFGETGMQTSHSGLGVDLHRIAQAAGFAAVSDIRGMEEVATYPPAAQARQRRAALCHDPHCARQCAPRTARPRWRVLKNRFRQHLGLGVN